MRRREIGEECWCMSLNARRAGVEGRILQGHDSWVHMLGMARPDLCRVLSARAGQVRVLPRAGVLVLCTHHGEGCCLHSLPACT